MEEKKKLSTKKKWLIGLSAVLVLLIALAAILGFSSADANEEGKTTEDNLAKQLVLSVIEDKAKSVMTELKLAVVNGLVNARKLLKDIDEGKAFYHLIEVMTCQGGCVGGAGQPRALRETKKKRGDGLYNIDHSAMFKRAEKNPIVVQMLEEMGEHHAHELLHVNYVKE